MDKAKFVPEKLNQISSALEAREELLELHDFIIPGKPPRIVTAALTNRNFHFMGFKRPLSNKAKLVGHSIIPLSDISTITTNIVKELIGQTLVLTFYWDGNKEVICSSKIDAATAFANEFKQLITNREIHAGATSIADEIAKLSELSKEGILSEDELIRAKELFLGRPPDHIDQSIQLLRNLRELQKQGVLSESEFNMKKWDILSKRDFS